MAHLRHRHLQSKHSSRFATCPNCISYQPEDMISYDLEEQQLRQNIHYDQACWGVKQLQFVHTCIREDADFVLTHRDNRLRRVKLDQPKRPKSAPACIDIERNLFIPRFPKRTKLPEALYSTLHTDFESDVS